MPGGKCQILADMAAPCNPGWIGPWTTSQPESQTAGVSIGLSDPRTKSPDVHHAALFLGVVTNSSIKEARVRGMQRATFRRNQQAA